MGLNFKVLGSEYFQWIVSFPGVLYYFKYN
jgi:hypothetical protein